VTVPRVSHGQSARYGLLGLPLAFVALPLYVTVPNHYAREYGVPLALLGAVLLAARLLDAFADPWIGRAIDRLYARSTGAVLGVCAAAAGVLAIGFALLFLPPVRGVPAVLAWAAATLAVTYLSFSVLTVAHQSWGAMLGGDEAQRSRIVGWREGFSVAGVLLASAAPLALGLPLTATLFAVLLGAGWFALRGAVRPAAGQEARERDLWLPLRRAGFRRLLGVFVLNGVASAIPATLVLFFVQDRLQAPRTLEPAFLGIYFACAALAIPGWLALVPRWGLARTWLAGMALAVAAFAWTMLLGPGDHWAFLAVCAVSGIALATDLALPGALLAGAIAQAGDRGQAEGAYFGWWNFAAKLNLALAAGLALPLLGWAGYTPGTTQADGQQALLIAYAVLPCVLKVAAAVALYRGLIRKEQME